MLGKLLTWLSVSALSTYVAACAGHRIPETPGDPSTPRISWSIHAGNADAPGQLLVCQSDPRSDCVVGASRPDVPFFASVRLYLHPASVEATYKGVMQIGFFGVGDAAHRVQVDAIVKPDDDPRSMLTYDRLPMKPGDYSLDIDLVAALGHSENERQIRDRAVLTVR